MKGNNNENVVIEIEKSNLQSTILPIYSIIQNAINKLIIPTYIILYYTFMTLRPIHAIASNIRHCDISGRTFALDRVVPI